MAAQRTLVISLTLLFGACGDDSGDAGTTQMPGTTAASSGSTTNSTTTLGTGSSTESVTSESSAGPASSTSGPPVTAGEFDILTYNVAGLPQGFSSSDPERNIPQISPLLNAYPLVLVQEDFWYHAELVTDVTLPHQSAPNPEDPMESGIGDGLNRFAEFPFETVERVTWYDCHGQTNCSSDCLAQKGWSFARTTVAEGVEIDVYNLHMEAGGCPEDIVIRTQAAMDLANAIAERSAGRALIVAGDFNLRATDKEDVEPLRLIVEGAGLTDACDAVACGDQRIDHIMFRSGDRVVLEAEAWSVPPEFVDAENGMPLSDHLPVAAHIAYGPA